jgi:hypothetical protein
MGTAAALSPTLFVPKARAAWTPGSPVHPHVDDLRVVALADPRMVRGTEVSCSWARQEELVVQEAVWENLDRLASGLTGSRSADEAWRTLFVKPPSKSWSDAVVAIKTNNISQQHTRSAVMAKVCHALTAVLGVKPTNIHIYDACHGGSMSRSTPFAGLPPGTRIEDEWGSYDTPTPVGPPWKDADGKSKCVRHLVDGSVDILVNIAMCKGHSEEFGGFTMAMKNHFGTFSPRPGHRTGAQDYLLAINRTPEILGPADPRTGRVIYPRQQLCIVDALWASQRGPGGNPTHQPNFLAMGVFAPVLDYQIATRFRRDKMGWPIDLSATRRMLTDFGRSEGDLKDKYVML